MGRLKKMEVGILNIKLHPHTLAKYVELMRELFEIGDLVQIRGDGWGTPNFIIDVIDGKPEDGLLGSFYRFTHIDPTKAWLDVKSRKALVDSKGEPIPQVSSDKQPNIREVEFTFYPNGHLLFFNAKAITPGSAQKLLAELFNNDIIKNKYSSVQVEIISTEEVVARILKIPTITRLDISISRPNGDNLTARKKAILKSMEDQGIRRRDESITSEKSEGIVPNQGTIDLMELATTNGSVSATGYSGSTRMVESTAPHPQIETTEYDEERDTFLRALAKFSSQLLAKVVARG